MVASFGRPAPAAAGQPGPVPASANVTIVPVLDEQVWAAVCARLRADMAAALRAAYVDAFGTEPEPEAPGGG